MNVEMNKQMYLLLIQQVHTGQQIVIQLLRRKITSIGVLKEIIVTMLTKLSNIHISVMLRCYMFVLINVL